MDQLEGLEGLTEIGRGGFGVVYKATETDLNRTVAVKVLNEASADLARKRLDRERRAMGVLSGHPNIVTIYRTGTTGNSPYLVMEFLGGGSLADRLLQGPAIPWQEAVNIGTALADAIEASHRAGVLHRDIKPANVLLSDTGVAKLGDFGIANVDAVSQTSGVMKATVAHAPPEVLSGREGDARS
ncbi:MAG: serine/threonine-protein kinase, partial [Acidimicrobiales bacterium]